MVEGDELGVAFERVEATWTPAKPACRSVVVRRFAIARKVRADVIEHAVEQDAEAAAFRLGDQVVEVGVVTEPGISPSSSSRNAMNSACRFRGAVRP